MDSINSTVRYSSVLPAYVPLTGGQQDSGDALNSSDSVTITCDKAPENHSKSKHRNRKQSEEPPAQPDASCRGSRNTSSVPADVDGWQIPSAKIDKAGGFGLAHKGITKEALAVGDLFQNLNSRCIWGSFGATALNVTPTVIKMMTEKEIEDAFKRGEALAKDPAKGGKITPGSIEEAAVALMAERYGVITAPAVREATGAAEIVDAAGKSWDVKSPLSPPQGAKWAFDVDHQVVKVRHDLGNNERVLLNLSKCNNEDTAKVIETMERELTDSEKLLIAVLVNREAVKS